MEKAPRRPLRRPAPSYRHGPAAAVDRAGLVGLYLTLTRNWQPLEQVSADEWMRRAVGERAYEVLWKPLLISKFGLESYRDVNMAWMWARLYKRTAALGYFVGGFQAFIDLLVERVEEQGGEVGHRIVEPRALVPDEPRQSGRGVAGSDIRTLKRTFLASPGLASLMAALRPAKHDYLFYVARGDGRHIFTSTYAEHLAARHPRGGDWLAAVRRTDTQRRAQPVSCPGACRRRFLTFHRGGGILDCRGERFVRCSDIRS